MRHLKISAADEGIFQSGHEELFDKNLDNTTPQSRSDLVSQAFLTNVAMGDPTNMASPPAVNPILNGQPMSGDELSAPARTTDTHDVFASYDAGRFAALRKYAQMNLPVGASKSTKPKGPLPPQVSATQAAAAQPNASKAVMNSGVAQGTGAAQTHSNAFQGEQPAQAPGATLAAPISTNSAMQFKPSTTPDGTPAPKQASLEVRDSYGTKEPQRYSIPADNGADYTPLTNRDDKTPKREVNKAFNDLAVQRNADHLNEMGQASIGAIG